MSRTWTGEELRTESRFAEFVARFNAGRFFTAHEILEELWLEIEGDERDFLQGLIQLAVAMEHRARGNPSGAAKVLSHARGRLRRYGPHHAGMPVEKILEEASACLRGERPDPPVLPHAADGGASDGRIREDER